MTAPRNAIQRLRANLPGVKPQLWEAPFFAVRRRLAHRWHARADQGWLDQRRVIALREMGLRMEVSLRNHFLDGSLYTFGVYEISGTRFVETVLGPGMVFFDVGANAGYYSLIAARTVGQRGAVHAFEPVARLRERLARNVELNALLNVEIHAEAITSHTGVVELYVASDRENEGLSSILPGGGRESTPAPVPAVTLDDEIERLGAFPSLVKLDIEGGEADAFRGAAKMLSGPHPPALMFEAERVDECARLLRDHGYDIRALHYTLRHGLEFHALGERFRNNFSGYEASNWVALPPGSRWSFEALSEASLKRIPAVLRLIGRIG